MLILHEEDYLFCCTSLIIALIPIMDPRSLRNDPHILAWESLFIHFIVSLWIIRNHQSEKLSADILYVYMYCSMFTSAA